MSIDVSSEIVGYRSDIVGYRSDIVGYCSDVDRYSFADLAGIVGYYHTWLDLDCKDFMDSVVCMGSMESVKTLDSVLS